MPPKNANKRVIGPSKPYKPMVSVCTPTFNRRPFIPIMFECFRNQTYPMDRIEWIIVDDGTDKIQDLVNESGISNIKYFPLEQKMPLGEKRNYMHKHAKGSIIVYMDDDDYYPPERIEHAVEKLQGDKNALVAGSSEMYIYFNHIKEMYQCGPYGPNHATAGTFAFKSRLLDDTAYENTAALAEEKVFLKNYTVPMVQLDPLKTILVFSHDHNTFDKKKLLENQHPNIFRPSQKQVADFIRQPRESGIIQFFTKDMDGLLAQYLPGKPDMKPDVMEQTKKLDETRKQMQMAQAAATGTQQTAIMVQEPGKPSRYLTAQETIQIMQDQQKEIVRLTARVNELELAMRQSVGSYSVAPVQRPEMALPKPPAATTDSNNDGDEVRIIEERSKFMPEIKVDTAAEPPTPPPPSPSNNGDTRVIEERSKFMPEIKVDI